MGEPHSSSPTTESIPAPTFGDTPLLLAGKAPSSPFVRVGGLLGIAGTLIGFVVLVLGCAGFEKVFIASRAVVGLGALGLSLSLRGGFFQRHRLGEDTHLLLALFVCILSIAGGLLEMAVLLKWPLFK